MKTVTEKKRGPYKKKDKGKKVTAVVEVTPAIAGTAVPENQKPVQETAEQTAQRLASEQNPITEPQKRTYKKREKQEESLSNTDLIPVTALMLHFANSRLPNPIEPTQTEIELISNSITKVVSLYSDQFTEYLPIVSLAGSLGMFFIPRLIKPEQVAPE